MHSGPSSQRFSVVFGGGFSECGARRSAGKSTGALSAENRTGHKSRALWSSCNRRSSSQTAGGALPRERDIKSVCVCVPVSTFGSTFPSFLSSQRSRGALCLWKSSGPRGSPEAARAVDDAGRRERVFHVSCSVYQLCRAARNGAVVVQIFAPQTRVLRN